MFTRDLPVPIMTRLAPVTGILRASFGPWARRRPSRQYGEAIGAGSGLSRLRAIPLRLRRSTTSNCTGWRSGLSHDSGVGLTGITGSGLSIFANSDGTGPYNFNRAIYVGSNTSVANWGLRV